MEQVSLLFWIVAGALALGVAYVLIRPLMRPMPDAVADHSTDLEIYTSQLAELDRDIARGVIAQDEAEPARTEIARRILAADKDTRQRGQTSPRQARIWGAGIIGVVMIAAGLFLYTDIGTPGYSDTPRAERIAAGNEMRRDRPSQRAAEQQVEERFISQPQISDDVRAMIDQLRDVVPQHPDDLQGWTLLSENEARLQNFEAAAEAQSRVVDLKGADATETDRYVEIFYAFVATEGDVDDALQEKINALAPTREMRQELWIAVANDTRQIGHPISAVRSQERMIATLGDKAEMHDYELLLDLMVSATLGVVTPEAENIAIHLLNEDPNNVTGLYYGGLLYAQTDRPDRAFEFYRRVVELADPESIHYQLARDQVENMAWLAGRDYTPPDRASRGPSAADVAAASDMSAEDRNAMIANMVETLSSRLAEEGGSPEEWAQLVRALGVLGETERASAIWSEAQTVFADNQGALDTIRGAAQSAGVAE